MSQETTQMYKHKIVELSHSNLDEAQSALRIIFPKEKYVSKVFEDSLKNDPNETLYRYWVIETQFGSVAGTTGVYYDDSTPDDLWLGWYGVLPYFRGLGYGRALLNFSIEQAKLRHAKNLRLWTSDEPDMAVSSIIYKKRGFVLEKTTREKKYKVLEYRLAL